MPPKAKSKAKKKVRSKSSSSKSNKVPTRYYQVPSNKYQTKEDVIKAFGYTLERQLDKGGFGTIFIAFDRRKNIKVACKWMDLGIATNDPRVLDTRNELLILEQVRHPYVIKVLPNYLSLILKNFNLHL